MIMPGRNLTILSCVILLLALGGVVGLSNTSTSPDGLSNDQIVLMQARQAVGSDVEQAEMHNQDGLALFAAGKYEEAVRHYNEAIKIDPNNVKGYNNRGVAYAKMGKYDQAISDYTKALQLNPQFAEAYHNRALASFRAKNYAQSCSDLQRLRQLGGTVSSEFVDDLESTSGIGRC
jgi:tetratricopeptide (TPR) repeat protein